MAAEEVEVVQEGFWKRYSLSVLLFSLGWLVLMGTVLPMALVIKAVASRSTSGWLTILLAIGTRALSSCSAWFADSCPHEIIRSNFLQNGLC